MSQDLQLMIKINIKILQSVYTYSVGCLLLFWLARYDKVFAHVHVPDIKLIYKQASPKMFYVPVTSY